MLIMCKDVQCADMSYMVSSCVKTVQISVTCAHHVQRRTNVQIYYMNRPFRCRIALTYKLHVVLMCKYVQCADINRQPTYSAHHVQRRKMCRYEWRWTYIAHHVQRRTMCIYQSHVLIVWKDVHCADISYMNLAFRFIRALTYTLHVLIVWKDVQCADIVFELVFSVQESVDV